MKTYKLNGLEHYICAFSKEEVVNICWLNGIGITEANVSETDIEPNRDAIGKVFTNLDEYRDYKADTNEGLVINNLLSIHNCVHKIKEKGLNAPFD